MNGLLNPFFLPPSSSAQLVHIRNHRSIGRGEKFEIKSSLEDIFQIRNRRRYRSIRAINIEREKARKKYMKNRSIAPPRKENVERMICHIFRECKTRWRLNQTRMPLYMQLRAELFSNIFAI